MDGSLSYIILRVVADESHNDLYWILNFSLLNLQRSYWGQIWIVSKALGTFIRLPTIPCDSQSSLMWVRMFAFWNHNPLNPDTFNTNKHARWGRQSLKSLSQTNKDDIENCKGTSHSLVIYCNIFIKYWIFTPAHKSLCNLIALS